MSLQSLIILTPQNGGVIIISHLWDCSYFEHIFPVVAWKYLFYCLHYIIHFVKQKKKRILHFVNSIFFLSYASTTGRGYLSLSCFIAYTILIQHSKRHSCSRGCRSLFGNQISYFGRERKRLGFGNSNSVWFLWKWISHGILYHIRGFFFFFFLIKWGKGTK